MRLGISGQALGSVLPFEDIIQMGKKYGVSDFEIWPCNAGIANDYGEADLYQLKNLLDKNDVRACCVTLGAAFDSQIQNRPEVYRSWLIHAIDAAKFLGAPVVNHYCYHISMSAEPDFHRLETYLREPLNYAEQQGIVLAMENEAHDSTATPEQMLKILQYFDNPYFKTNLDVVNYFHASCEGFPAAYETLRPYIGYVHLKNACLYRGGTDQPESHRGGPMAGHHSPGFIQYCTLPEGAVNIPGLLTRIAADDSYDGVCTLEPHTTPDFVEDFYAKESAWLRQLNFFNE